MCLCVCVTSRVEFDSSFSLFSHSQVLIIYMSVVFLFFCAVVLSILARFQFFFISSIIITIIIIILFIVLLRCLCVYWIGLDFFVFCIEIYEFIYETRNNETKEKNNNRRRKETLDNEKNEKKNARV